MIRYFSLCMAAMLLVLHSPAQAEALKSEGMIPEDLSFTRQDGVATDFAKLKGANGLVLVFFRSADWCSYCQTQLKSLKDVAKPLADRGYALAAASYDQVETLRVFHKIHKLNYPLLADKDSKAITAFGILDEEAASGTSYYGIPHPTIFVIDKTGKILNVLSEAGYKKRPTNSAILAALP